MSNEPSGDVPGADDGPVHDVGMLIAAFEQDPNVMVVCSGPQHRMMAINRAGRDVVPGRKTLGQAYYEVTPEIREQGWEEIFDRVYRTGEAVAGHEWNTQLHHADGTTSAYYFNLDVQPVRGDDGSVVGIVFRGNDVTDAVLARQRTETELATVTSRYEQAREVVSTLQRALLLDRVPVLPTVQISAHHLLAAEETVAGGDWFDVVERDTRVVLVVGDVVGHGVEAAAAMGQARAVLLDRLRDGVPIDEAVAGLDRRAAHEPASFGTTLCLVDLDPDSGAFTYVTAGHPPPLVLDGAGAEAAERFLEPTGAGPLGAGRTAASSSRSDRLAPGACVVLYTNGVVELPNTAPAQSTLDLARTVRNAVDNRALPARAPGLAVERITTQTIELLTRIHGHADDITLLAAQRVPAPVPLELRMRADSAAVRTSQNEVRSWLDRLDVRPEDTEAVLHTAVELVQNAADHAYLDTAPGEVSLRLALGTGGVARLTVADAGRWRERQGTTPGRGLGLALARSHVDSVDVQTADCGTTVTVHQRLSRPAGPMTGTRTRREDVRELFDAWHHRVGDRLHIGARGPLDAESVDELRAHLSLGLAPGEPPASLDLSGITLLSSAGVHMILRAREKNPSIEVIAPAGSVAQHVLTLVAVSHTTGAHNPLPR